MVRKITCYDPYIYSLIQPLLTTHFQIRETGSHVEKISLLGIKEFIYTKLKDQHTFLFFGSTYLKFSSIC